MPNISILKLGNFHMSDASMCQWMIEAYTFCYTSIIAENRFSGINYLISGRQAS